MKTQISKSTGKQGLFDDRFTIERLSEICNPLEKLGKSDKGQPLYADSAYTEENQKKVLRKYKLKNKVHEKGYMGKPLTDKQK